MRKVALVLLAMTALIFIAGCGGGGDSVAPEINMAPVWAGHVGIQSVTPDDSAVTLTFGTATDPDGGSYTEYVVYTLYGIDATATGSDNPFTGPGHVKIPNFGVSGSPYNAGIVTGLTNNHIYWFGVRASDYKGLEESNLVKLSAQPIPFNNLIGMEGIWDFNFTVQGHMYFDDDTFLPIDENRTGFFTITATTVTDSYGGSWSYVYILGTLSLEQVSASQIWDADCGNMHRTEDIKLFFLMHSNKTEATISSGVSGGSITSDYCGDAYWFTTYTGSMTKR